jgi:hypothetical protein
MRAAESIYSKLFSACLMTAAGTTVPSAVAFGYGVVDQRGQVREQVTDGSPDVLPAVYADRRDILSATSGGDKSAGRPQIAEKGQKSHRTKHQRRA